MHRIVATPLFYRRQNVDPDALHSLLQRSGLYCAEIHRQNAKNFCLFLRTTAQHTTTTRQQKAFPKKSRLPGQLAAQTTPRKLSARKQSEAGRTKHL